MSKTRSNADMANKLAFDSIAAMEAFIPVEDDNVAIVIGLQGGTFTYDSSRILENDGGTIFNGWARQYDGAINIKWFGHQSMENFRQAIEATNYNFPVGQLFTGLDWVNKTTDTTSALNVGHFAGQGTGDAYPVAFILHNYTDAPSAQFDHVGNSIILKLKNAANSTRRPDKPSDYQGESIFLHLSNNDDGTLFTISKDVTFDWETKNALFNAKNTTSGFPFRFNASSTTITSDLHTEFMSNSVQFGYIRTRLNRFEIAGSGDGGLYLESTVGNTTLKAPDGNSILISTGTISKIKAASGNLSLEASGGSAVQLESGLGLKRYATIASAPNLASDVRALAWADDINRMITYDGNVWV